MNRIVLIIFFLAFVGLAQASSSYSPILEKVHFEFDAAAPYNRVQVSASYSPEKDGMLNEVVVSSEFMTISLPKEIIRNIENANIKEIEIYGIAPLRILHLDIPFGKNYSATNEPEYQSYMFSIENGKLTGYTTYIHNGVKFVETEHVVK